MDHQSIEPGQLSVEEILHALQALIDDARESVHANVGLTLGKNSFQLYAIEKFTHAWALCSAVLQTGFIALEVALDIDLEIALISERYSDTWAAASERYDLKLSELIRLSTELRERVPEYGLVDITDYRFTEEEEESTRKTCLDCEITKDLTDFPSQPSVRCTQCHVQWLTVLDEHTRILDKDRYYRARFYKAAERIRDEKPGEYGQLITLERQAVLEFIYRKFTYYESMPRIYAGASRLFFKHCAKHGVGLTVWGLRWLSRVNDWEAAMELLEDVMTVAALDSKEIPF